MWNNSSLHNLELCQVFLSERIPALFNNSRKVFQKKYWRYFWNIPWGVFLGNSWRTWRTDLIFLMLRQSFTFQIIQTSDVDTRKSKSTFKVKSHALGASESERKKKCPPKPHRPHWLRMVSRFAVWGFTRAKFNLNKISEIGFWASCTRHRTGKWKLKGMARRIHRWCAGLCQKGGRSLPQKEISSRNVTSHGFHFSNNGNWNGMCMRINFRSERTIQLPRYLLAARPGSFRLKGSEQGIFCFFFFSDKELQSFWFWGCT